ncbi:MAG: YkgJ family cysteine cluster protein [Romboutsia sp.]
MTSIKKTDVLKCIDYVNENSKLEELNKVYKSLPSGDCSGCGNCCMESVGINLIEFINIYNHLQKNERVRKVALEKILDYYFLEYTKKSPCPFRDSDNRCIIYEVRPLNCRLFGHWKKDDYNSNLENVIQRNINYKNLMKIKYGFDISSEVVNFRIKYCESFITQDGYLDKSTRLGFADKLMILDSDIYSKGIIDIEFKDRGIVEYFIDLLFDENIAYNVKVRVSKVENIRYRAISRLKKIIVR